MDAVRAPFSAFGGTWVDAPVLQPLSTLLDLAGEAMRARLVVVSAGAEDSALRPDFTIPVVQAHIDTGRSEGRFLYEGKAFAASGAEGGASEHRQIGAEMFGPGADPAADDATIIALGWDAARAGGRSDLSIQLGDIGLFQSFLGALRLPQPAIARLVRALPTSRGVRLELDRAASREAPANGGGKLASMLADLPEGEGAAMLEELWRLAGIQPVGGRSPAEIVHRLALRAEASRNPPLSPAEVDLIGRYLALSGAPHVVLEEAEALAAEGGGDLSSAVAAWVRRLKALASGGVPIHALNFGAAFARPFGYYDGVLFEVRSAALGADRPVAAGGRYDGLPARLGGAPGAVGCMVRPARAWSGS
jgi:ATP phosphoribosyltransferase regulatory subunit